MVLYVAPQNRAGGPVRDMSGVPPVLDGVRDKVRLNQPHLLGKVCWAGLGHILQGSPHIRVRLEDGRHDPEVE